MDTIRLEGIRLNICVGVTEVERQQAQPCEIDLVLETDLEPAGRSGDLRDSVNYAAVFRTVAQLSTGGSFVLLEEIAHQACQKIMEDTRITSVRFRISKLKPFDERIQSVGVEVVRHREE